MRFCNRCECWDLLTGEHSNRYVLCVYRDGEEFSFAVCRKAFHTLKKEQFEELKKRLKFKEWEASENPALRGFFAFSRYFKEEDRNWVKEILKENNEIVEIASNCQYYFERQVL